MSNKYSGLEAALRSARMTFDNNVWSPDTYPQGWEVVEVEDGGAA